MKRDNGDSGCRDSAVREICKPFCRDSDIREYKGFPNLISVILEIVLFVRLEMEFVIFEKWRDLGDRVHDFGDRGHGR